MRLYLAGTAPGTEGWNKKMCDIPTRLLSYYQIKAKSMPEHIIFRIIKKGMKK